MARRRKNWIEELVGGLVFLAVVGMVAIAAAILAGVGLVIWWLA